MKVLKLDLSKIPNAVKTVDGNGNPILVVRLTAEGTTNGSVFNGAKGVYMDCILWENDQPDQYDNWGSIQVSLSKEMREAGHKGEYVGNMKKIGS